VTITIVSLAAIGAALVAWPQMVSPSTTAKYLPHSFCYLDDPRLISLHVIADTAIWLSYMAISATLGYFLWCNRRLLPFRTIFVDFSLFVVACGFTHLMEVIVLWHPFYWFAGGVKLVTAVFSVITACILPPLLPELRELLVGIQKTRALEARFIAAVEGGTDAFYILEAGRDPNGKLIDFTYVFLNRNVEKMSLLPTGDLLGRSLCELPMAGGAITFLELFESFKTVMLTGEPTTREFQQKKPDHSIAWVRMQIVRLADGVAVTISDITAPKKAEEQALYMAHHDILTGLPNRNLMDERLLRALDRANRYRHKVGVFLLDLDSFKHINDTYGHATGDEVLIVIAKRLTHAVRVTDSVLRLGGDEFVVILPDINTSEDIERIAGKILAELAQPIVTANTTVDVPCSLGICIYPDFATTASHLLHGADEAMYTAKRSGGNRFATCAAHPTQ
jgi:diguanylate cyclase (GGDEF)-like protein